VDFLCVLSDIRNLPDIWLHSLNLYPLTITSSQPTSLRFTSIIPHRVFSVCYTDVSPNIFLHNLSVYSSPRLLKFPPLCPTFYCLKEFCLTCKTEFLVTCLELSTNCFSVFLNWSTFVITLFLNTRNSFFSEYHCGPLLYLLFLFPGTNIFMHIGNISDYNLHLIFLYFICTGFAFLLHLRVYILTYGNPTRKLDAFVLWCEEISWECWLSKQLGNLWTLWFLRRQSCGRKTPWRNLWQLNIA